MNGKDFRAMVEFYTKHFGANATFEQIKNVIGTF